MINYPIDALELQLTLKNKKVGVVYLLEQAMWFKKNSESTKGIK